MEECSSEDDRRCSGLRNVAPVRKPSELRFEYFITLNNRGARIGERVVSNSFATNEISMAKPIASSEIVTGEDPVCHHVINEQTFPDESVTYRRSRFR